MIRYTRIPRLNYLGAGSLLPSARQLHTTKVSSDFFSWFKSKKNQDQEPTVPTKGTQELISDIEAGKTSKISNKQKLELIPENFIGEEEGELAEKARAKQIKGVPFNRWLSAKKLEGTFPDLVIKFNFTKSLQASSGYLIPDYQLTILNTPAQFKNYICKEILSGKQARYKESEPNAIHLSSAQFTSPNIYIVPDVKPKAQKNTYRKIIREVNILEAESARRAIEQARQS